MEAQAQRQAIETMLSLQDKMNRKVHPDWIGQQFEWYRAIWIECGELMDHQGYKWWKKQQPELEQVRLEIIDIWHFGMSALFTRDSTPAALADTVAAGFAATPLKAGSVLEATEAVAEYALTHKSLSIPAFHGLMQAAGLSFSDLYRHYIGKNVLNFFRQDNGYKTGTYVKTWDGREDNEHLSEILSTLDSSAADYKDQVYAALQDRYNTLARAS